MCCFRLHISSSWNDITNGPGLLHLSAIPSHVWFVLGQLRDSPAGCEWLQQLWVSHPHAAPSRTRETLPAAALKDEKVPLSRRPMLYYISLILVGLCAHLWTNPCGQRDWMASRLPPITAKSWNCSWAGKLRLSRKRETRIDAGETKNSCLLQQLQGSQTTKNRKPPEVSRWKWEQS